MRPRHHVPWGGSSFDGTLPGMLK